MSVSSDCFSLAQSISAVYFAMSPLMVANELAAITQ